MGEKKTLRVNMDELCEAMENSSYENENYLDFETGEILFLSEYMDDARQQRLGRYLLNSARFLWGLGNKTQKQVYQWLFQNGFRKQIKDAHDVLMGERVYKGDYATVEKEMLEDHKIKKS